MFCRCQRTFLKSLIHPWGVKYFEFIQALILDPVLEVLITQTTHLFVDIWLHSVYYFSSWSFQYQFPYTFYSSFLFIIFDVRLIWNEITSSDIEILAWICDNDHGFFIILQFQNVSYQFSIARKSSVLKTIWSSWLKIEKEIVFSV